MKLTMIAALAAGCACLAVAQSNGQAGQAGQGQSTQPKISEKQRDAIMKVQTAAQAQNWDGVLQAATELIENFPDSPYRGKITVFAMQAAANENNYDQMVIWGDRAIQNDPNDVMARIQIADAIANHTRDTDFDKDQKVKKVQDYAHKGLEILQNENTVPPDAPVDPSRWPEVKQQLTGEAHYALGVAADLQKDETTAQNELNQAIQASPNAMFYARVSKVDNELKQYDAAATAAQKALSAPDASAAVKQYAQQQLDRANAAKGAAK